MNAINATTTEQFHACGPATLKYARRQYKRQGGLFDDETNTVRFDFVARKRRGAFLADKVTVSVQYDGGADLYDVTIVHFDGETFETTEIATYNGATFDSFENIGATVARA